MLRTRTVRRRAAVVAVATCLLASCTAQDPSSPASTAATSSSTADPAPSGTADPLPPDVLVPAPSGTTAPAAPAPPVAPTGAAPPTDVATATAAVSSPVDLGGLEVTVVAIDPVELQALGPGQVGGEGAAVRLRLTNRTAAPVDGGGVEVGATYGDQAAASSTSAPSQVAGTVPVGAGADAVYAFVVPADRLDELRVEVRWTGAPGVVVVQG